MRILIVANGRPAPADPERRWASQFDRILAADGGAAAALSWGLVPDLVVGDLDSLPAQVRAALEAQGCPFDVHPQAKDETDLELALNHAVQQGADEIVILGALGGRLDHTLSNVLLLALPQLATCSVRIVDGPEEAFLVRSGERVEVQGRPGDLISLLPLAGDARGVSTGGLLWPLAGDTLCYGFSRGVSNEMVSAEATVKLEEGLLLLIHRRAGSL